MVSISNTINLAACPFLVRLQLHVHGRLSPSATAAAPVDNTKETPEENPVEEVKDGEKDPKDSEKFLFGPLLSALTGGGHGGGLGLLGGLLGGGHHHHGGHHGGHHFHRPPPYGYPPYGPHGPYGGYGGGYGGGYY